jgi:hypothetical protein
VNLICQVFGGKTGPMATFWVFGVVRPVATVRFRVELYPEPTREFGPVANTRWFTCDFETNLHFADINPKTFLTTKTSFQTFKRKLQRRIIR